MNLIHYKNVNLDEFLENNLLKKLVENLVQR